jgi:Putative transmembrane protein (PGPGW)
VPPVLVEPTAARLTGTGETSGIATDSGGLVLHQPEPAMSPTAEPPLDQSDPIPGEAAAESHGDDGPLDEILEWSIEAEEQTAHEATEAEAERGLVRRVARIVAGTSLVVVGLFLLVLPGPGLVTIAAGLALLARDVPFARRWLAIVRARIPESDEGKVAGWVIVLSVVAFVASLGGSLIWFFVLS